VHTLTDRRQVEDRPPPDRDEESVADEQMDLAVHELVAVVEVERMDHDRKVPLEDLDLAPLIPVDRVLDRQRMKPELFPQQLELPFVGVAGVHPQPDVRIREELCGSRRIASLVLHESAAIEMTRQHGPRA
jgi:hypothetical protein